MLKISLLALEEKSKLLIAIRSMLSFKEPAAGVQVTHRVKLIIESLLSTDLIL